MMEELHENYPLQDLTKDIQLPLPPIPGELTPAVADMLNLPLSDDEQANYNNDSFVDDNGICAIASRIIQAIQQSLLSAFLLFGWPYYDRRGSLCDLYSRLAVALSFSASFVFPRYMRAASADHWSGLVVVLQSRFSLWWSGGPVELSRISRLYSTGPPCSEGSSQQHSCELHTTTTNHLLERHKSKMKDIGGIGYHAGMQ
jgi:hypothetical protein